MPFYVGSSCLLATISDRRINRIVQSDIPPEMSLWEKLKKFYGNVAKITALVNFAAVFTSDGIREHV